MVMFDLSIGFEYVPSTRPWEKANWGLFCEVLRSADIYISDSMTTKKLDSFVTKLNAAINDALDKCCPLTPGHFRDPHNPWFTQWMWDLRARVERLLSTATKKPNPFQCIKIFPYLFPI